MSGRRCRCFCGEPGPFSRCCVLCSTVVGACVGRGCSAESAVYVYRQPTGLDVLPCEPSGVRTWRSCGVHEKKNKKRWSLGVFQQATRPPTGRMSSGSIMGAIRVHLPERGTLCFQPAVLRRRQLSATSTIVLARLTSGAGSRRPPAETEILLGETESLLDGPETRVFGGRAFCSLHAFVSAHAP